MPFNPYRTFPFAMLFVLLINPAKSQDIEVGLTAGGSYYLGDLNPGMHFQGTQLMYGFLARLNLDSRWSFRVSGLLGSVEGSAAGSPYLPGRNLSFNSKLTDFAGVVEFNFLPYFTGSQRSRFSPFIFGGISAFFFQPFSNGVSLQPLGTEGQNSGYLGRSPYSTFSISLPFGLGVKLSLTQRLSMQAFWQLHKTFTDYIDDISTTYYLIGKDIDPNDLAAMMSDPNRDHMPGMQRGNSGTNDWYAFTGVSLTYKFNLNSRKKCLDDGQ